MHDGKCACGGLHAYQALQFLRELDLAFVTDIWVATFRCIDVVMHDGKCACGGLHAYQALQFLRELDLAFVTDIWVATFRCIDVPHHQRLLYQRP